jgi:hypothetical protein
MIADTIELVIYFFAFWLFIFSPKYRKIIVQHWENSNLLKKIFFVIDALFSFLIGIGIIVLLIILISLLI